MGIVKSASKRQKIGEKFAVPVTFFLFLFFSLLLTNLSRVPSGYTGYVFRIICSSSPSFFFYFILLNERAEA